MRLTGERVALRPLEAGDRDFMLATRAEPAVRRWWGPPENDEWPFDDPETTVLTVEVAGERAGLIQFWEEEEPAFRHASVDLFLATAFHGRGLGGDAIRAVARHLLVERGHHRLTIDPAAANLVAIRAYARVGFRRVGVTRRSWWDHAEGRWVDGLLMDLLAGELI